MNIKSFAQEYYVQSFDLQTASKLITQLCLLVL
jgi:hypothetical protein